MPATTPLSQRQVLFITDLVTQINEARAGVVPPMDPLDLADTLRFAGTLSMAGRSGYIDGLIRMRTAARRESRSAALTATAAVAATLPAASDGASVAIPAGYYAIDGAVLQDPQPVVFVAVIEMRRRDGSVARRYRRVVGGRLGGTYYGVRAQAIEAEVMRQGVLESAQRYAAQIGRCYVCNTRLTDADSRALGIGPDCRSGRSQRGQAFRSWIVASRRPSPEMAARVRDGIDEARAAATDPDRPTSGTCSCGEAAVGYRRTYSSYTVLCDECAIDQDVSIRLFRINPRLRAVAS